MISDKTLCSFKYGLCYVFFFFFNDGGNNAASRPKYAALSARSPTSLLHGRPWECVAVRVHKIRIGTEETEIMRYTRCRY